MQQNKTIVILGLVLVLMVGGIWLRSNISNADQDIEAYMAQVGDIVASDVTQVEIATAGASLRLTKEGLGWKIQDKTADGDAVLELLNQLLNPTDVVLVSETEESHADLGVTEEEAIIVRLSNPQETRELLLASGTGGGAYIRSQAQAEVYQLDPFVNVEDLSNPNDWLDLTIVRLPTDTISAIRINQNGADQIQLTQADGVWTSNITGESSLETTGFMSLLTRLAAFSSERLVEQDVSQLTPMMTVTVERINDTPLELRFYESDDDDLVWVQVSDKEGVFEVYDSDADDFRLNEVDLIPQN